MHLTGQPVSPPVMNIVRRTSHTKRSLPLMSGYLAVFLHYRQILKNLGTFLEVLGAQGKSACIIEPFSCFYTQ